MCSIRILKVQCGTLIHILFSQLLRFNFKLLMGFWQLEFQIVIMLPGGRHILCWMLPYHCPACRTTLIATRFWVVMICPIIKCLTVLRVFFYFVWFVFIHDNFQFYFELCTYCNILDIYLSYNLNFVNYLLFYMKLLNYLFFNMFGSVLECCELTGVSLLWPWLIKWK